MKGYRHVFPQTFKPSELIFDEEETKEILKFFFIKDHAFIDGLIIHDRIRNFAQGILVEAVEASFAIGFVEIVYDTFCLKPPTPNVKKVFSKFGKNAARHWFKHVSVTDLTEIKVYDFVKNMISIKLRSQMLAVASDIVQSKPVSAVIAYNIDKRERIIWG